MSDGPQQAPAVPDPFAPGSLFVSVVGLTRVGIPGAEVTVAQNGLMVKAGVTDDNGEITFNGLPPSEYDVTVAVAGFGLSPKTGKLVVGPVKGPLKVWPGPEPTTLLVVMAAPGVAFLRVRVQDQANKPLDKVAVDISGSAAQHKLTKGGIATFGPLPAPGALKILAGNKDFTLKPHYGLANAPPDPVKFERVESSAVLTEGRVSSVVIQLAEHKLEITKIDANFAPSVETCDITFAIKGLAKRKVTLTIEAENYPGKTVVERGLSDVESADGEHNVIAFSGKIEVGTLKDQFITPLMGPFKVRLEHVDANNTGILKTEKPFKVLYHSLELAQGPWTPDEADPPETLAGDWVAFKLNKLGFWGGPVAGDTDEYRKKAIIAYKSNHLTMWKEFFSDYTADIDPVLTTALRNNVNGRPFIEGSAITDKSATSKLFVDVLPYQKLKPSGDEFGSEHITKQKARLNRPLLPIEATIFLKGKGGGKVSFPEGVGECRISVRVKDPDEDLSAQFADTAAAPSKTKAYIEKALKLVSGRTGDNGDNCPETLGGIRKGPGLDFDQCFLLGDLYKPYSAASDGGQKVVFVKACVDKANFPKRVGKAGLFFRPSYIAGDDYKLTFEVDFTGLPNQAALEADHGVTSVATRVHAETGTFRVIRRGRVSTVIGWPARTGPSELDKIVTEFGKAHIQLDTGGAAAKSITDVLTNAEYVAACPGPGVTLPAGLALTGTKYYGAAVAVQGSLSAADYKTLLRTAVVDNFEDINVAQVGAVISKKIRTVDPSGFIFVNFHLHEPLNIQAAPPLNTTVSDPDFITWGTSMGLADSTVMIDMKDPDQVYYVFAHEMGHNLFLMHHENAGRAFPIEHDTSDHNCLMSYSTKRIPPNPPHQAPHTYTPHFCGKCNLKIRGWDVTNAAMPASSA